jgi:hypothetical protein
MPSCAAVLRLEVPEGPAAATSIQNIRWFSNADSGPVAGFYNRVGGLQLSRKRVPKPISASQSSLAGARTAASIFRTIPHVHKTRRPLYGRLNVR